MAVVLRKFTPQVTCRGTITEWRSCISILYRMPTSPEENIFGPESDPHTDVELPAIIVTGTNEEAMSNL